MFFEIYGGGCFSEYAVIPEAMLHNIPEAVSYEQGALVEPSAVALHAVRQSKLKVGDKAAVFGTGPSDGPSRSNLVVFNKLKKQPGCSQAVFYY